MEEADTKELREIVRTEDDGMINVVFGLGRPHVYFGRPGWGGLLYITPAQMRELAAALVKVADHADGV